MFLDYSMALWRDLPLQLHKIYDTVKYSVGSSENKIIHGDNLLALKSLLPEYRGKVKCIYIDPPYNTGNEGWVYNDNVNDPQIKRWLGQVVGREGEDFTRHDKWLCMMYPRLRLLQKLLSKDGVIFISINFRDEYYSLRLICDEIFGVNNYVGTLTWESLTQPTNSGKAKFGLQIKTEPILCYRNHADENIFKLTLREPKGHILIKEDSVRVALKLSKRQMRELTDAQQ